MAEVHGHVESGFEPVREAFAANFDQHGEVGAAFALHVGGRLVVDLWGGVADQQTGRPWEENTTQLVFSTTKGATAICALRLVERGELDLDAPVVRYWPEFGAEGKDEVPVRWLLSHRSGLPVIDAHLTLEEALAWDPVIEALAAQKPVWEPGTAHGYHALTYGWLVGELVRRVSGKSLGTFFADEVAGPLGLDFWIGVPTAHRGRVSRLVTQQIGGNVDIDALEKMGLPPEVVEMAKAFADPDSLSRRALSLGASFGGEDVWNQEAVHAAEIPAANGITTARSLSRMYAAAVGEVDGVRLLGDDIVQQATTTQSEGPDKVLFVPTRFGLGFMLNSMFSPMGGGERTFGHSGAGGSLGYADPVAGVAYGYVMNKMQSNLGADPRTLGLNTAVYECL